MKDKKKGTGYSRSAASESQDKEHASSQQPAASSCTKCDDYLLGWKRALADYDNLKKDLASERSRMREYVEQDAAERILPVLDNFDQALAFKPDGVDAKIENWLQGLLYVRTQLENVMAELGASPFGSADEHFDPSMHDAAGEKQQAGKAPGVVLEIVRRGWRRGEHMIRPAKVIVSK